MDETKKPPMTEKDPQQPAPSPAPAKKVIAPEVDIICLPSWPKKPKTKEDIIYAKRIANRYLNIPHLEKILRDKKAKRKKNAHANRFKLPETPDEFYDRGQKYLTGALCAVPFQEKATYYKKAADMFAGAGDFQDAPELVKTYTALADTTLKEGYHAAYQEALALKEHAISEDDWFTAAKAFQRIPGYERADELAEECQRKLDMFHSAKRPLQILALLLVAGLIFGCVQVAKSDGFRYQAAKAAASVGFESAAYSLLQNLDGYSDSEKLMHSIRYEQGVEQMADGNYSSAAKSFGKAEGYADSQTLMEECYYQIGAAALEQSNYDKALENLSKAGGYSDGETLRFQAELACLAQAELGDKITFGQDKYILLDRRDNQVLLLSAKLFGKSGYHSTLEKVTWEDCAMRTRLNSEYLTEKFSEEEQALISSTLISEGVEDKLFLLSAEEYQRYQPVMGKKDALWWLRDNGATEDSAVFVSCDGTVMEAGYPVNDTHIQGRPALWVSLPTE